MEMIEYVNYINLNFTTPLAANLEIFSPES